MRLMLSLLVIIVGVVAGVYGLVRYLELTAVFYPTKTVHLEPSRMGLAHEDVYITTSDGVRINAWFVKSRGAKSTLIFAHGNAGNMGDRLIKVKFFHDLGLNVLIFDYRGYGRSEGRPSEKGVYLDAQAAYDYLKIRTDVDMGRIIVYGASLGGVVAVDLATARPTAALIVDSSITCAADAARRFYAFLPVCFMGLKFNSIEKIKHLTVPKLFMHSREDEVIPYEMGRRLFEVAAPPKEFITTSGSHNEVHIVTDQHTIDALRKYLISQGLL